MVRSTTGEVAWSDNDIAAVQPLQAELLKC
jgi:hypothetical protein